MEEHPDSIDDTEESSSEDLPSYGARGMNEVFADKYSVEIVLEDRTLRFGSFFDPDQFNVDGEGYETKASMEDMLKKFDVSSILKISCVNERGVSKTSARTFRKDIDATAQIHRAVTKPPYAIVYYDKNKRSNKLHEEFSKTIYGALPTDEQFEDEVLDQPKVSAQPSERSINDIYSLEIVDAEGYATSFGSYFRASNKKGFKQLGHAFSELSKANIPFSSGNVLYVVTGELDPQSFQWKNFDDVDEKADAFMRDALQAKRPCAVIYGTTEIEDFITESHVVLRADRFQIFERKIQVPDPTQGGKLTDISFAFVVHQDVSNDALLKKIGSTTFDDDNIDPDPNKPLEVLHRRLLKADFDGGIKNRGVRFIPGLKANLDDHTLRARTAEEIEEFISIELAQPKNRAVQIQNPKIIKENGRIAHDTDVPPSDIPPLPEKNQHPTSALFFGFLFFFLAVPVYTFGYAMVTQGFTPGFLGYDALTVLSQFLQVDPVVIVFSFAAILTVVAIGCAIGSFCRGGGGSAHEVSTEPDHGKRAIDEYVDLVGRPDQSFKSSTVFAAGVGGLDSDSELEKDDAADDPTNCNGLN